MGGITRWIGENWNVIVIPAAILVLTLIALLWLRRWALRRFLKHVERSPSLLDNIVDRAIRVPSIKRCGLNSKI